MTLPRYPADENIEEIQQYALAANASLLRVAELLLENRKNKYWAVCEGHTNYPTFQVFVESLGIRSYNYCGRLMRVIEARDSGVITKEQLGRMQLSCALELLPVIRRGELTPEIIEAAMTGHVSELRKVLGRKPIKADTFVQCPNCGAEFKLKEM